MIQTSKKVDKIFFELHIKENYGIKKMDKFKKIMESNESRINYLLNLFKKIEQSKLNKECEKVLSKNIEFLNNFMNGRYGSEITVPEAYEKDKDKNLIVPTEGDIEYLFHLFKSNVELFNMLYKDKRFVIELPKNTLNQNMIRVLEVKYHNLAHLLGLTESELTPDDNKNQLKKYFLNNVENQEQYGDKISERLLNWLLSEEGQEEVKTIFQITLDYIEDDRIKNPNSYDQDGNIKLKSLQKFRERFKKDTGYDYPIIKFSRCMSKCLNNFNFLQMTNITQMVLDYNAPIGKTDEKDIFIVNCPQETMTDSINVYKYLREEIIKLLNQYASSNDEKEKRELAVELKMNGIDVKDKDFDSYINMIKTKSYFEEKGIYPDMRVINIKINNAITSKQTKNIHIIGFDTVFPEGNIPLDRKTANRAHCDTSISLTATELVGEFYERGRPFFIDKVESQGRYIRISNPTEEINYIKQLQEIGIVNVENLIMLESLQEKLREFNERYYLFVNKNDGGYSK